jgi:hypothetical protein
MMSSGRNDKAATARLLIAAHSRCFCNSVRVLFATTCTITIRYDALMRWRMNDSYSRRSRQQDMKLVRGPDAKFSNKGFVN